MSTIPPQVELYVDIAPGRRFVCDSNGRQITDGFSFYRGDETFQVTVLDAGSAATTADVEGATWQAVLKDPDDLDGITVLADTEATGGSVTASANVLTLLLPTNTTEMDTFLGAHKSKSVRFELTNLSGGAEVAGPSAHSTATVLADANRGSESDPTPGSNTMLTALAALTPAADKIIELTSATAAALRTIGSVGRSLLSRATAADARSDLALGDSATRDVGTTSGAVAAGDRGVSNGNSHDHDGGDGNQIDHGGLGGLGDDDHPQYYRDQTPAAAAEVSGADVAPDFTNNSTLIWTLDGNITSFADATGLADGETGAIWITIGAYALPSEPPSGAYEGGWTVDGTRVWLAVERLGDEYRWSAESLEVVT